MMGPAVKKLEKRPREAFSTQELYEAYEKQRKDNDDMIASEEAAMIMFATAFLLIGASVLTFVSWLAMGDAGPFALVTLVGVVWVIHSRLKAWLLISKEKAE